MGYIQRVFICEFFAASLVQKLHSLKFFVHGLGNETVQSLKLNLLLALQNFIAPCVIVKSFFGLQAKTISIIVNVFVFDL